MPTAGATSLKTICCGAPPICSAYRRGNGSICAGASPKTAGDARAEVMRPVTLITGASAGIGAELARVFAAHGHELVLVARREADLTALADEIAAAGRRAAAGAAARSASSAMRSARLAAELTASGLEPDIVVNNAGFGLAGDAAALDRDDQLAHDRSQYAGADRAVARLCRQPGAPSRRHSQCRLGRCLHARPRHGGVLRQQGLCAVVQRSAAPGAKTGRGVRVTALCPGPVPTGFQVRAGLRAGRIGEGGLLALPPRRVARDRL